MDTSLTDNGHFETVNGHLWLSVLVKNTAAWLVRHLRYYKTTKGYIMALIKTVYCCYVSC